MIMCGGVGSRFWPFSRQDKPKQFLDFFGTGQSLLQTTFERVLEVVDPQRVYLVTNKQYAPLIREQLPQVPEKNILLEPARRNTSPCICWAAHHIHALDPDASIVTLPSDHLVLKEAAFHKALRKGFEFVEAGDRLLTLGICPSSPHTGYGYIQKGEEISGNEDFMKVKSFTEKPSLEMATVFLQSGEFFWNAGIFLWRADTILKAFEKYAPETASVFDAGNGLYATPDEERFIAEAFPTAPSISIDYAIMEKAPNVYVETVDIGWSDLGSWKALYDVAPHDLHGNVTQGCRLVESDCSGSIFAVAGEKVIVASGLKDYIVADNDNTLLICPTADEQKIRQFVNDVRTQFGEEYV